MKITTSDLIAQLSMSIDADLSRQSVESYVEMQQRFLAGDWQPTELDGGRLCEAISRAIYQLDTGTINHSKLPGEIRDYLLDNSGIRPHTLQAKDRSHLAKVIELVYKFRSDRGAVHISPLYTANFMDSMLVVHAGKWIFSEFLRLAWNADRQTVADTVAQIVQLEHSLIHEIEGKPLVLAVGIKAPDEILILLNHAPNNRLTRSEIRSQATHQKPDTVNVAIKRLIAQKLIRPLDTDEVTLTPLGQKRLIETILPKYSP